MHINLVLPKKHNINQTKLGMHILDWSIIANRIDEEFWSILDYNQSSEQHYISWCFLTLIKNWNHYFEVASTDAKH